MSATTRSSSPLNVLISWPYYKGAIVEHLVGYQDECRFLLDSGAFTAWRANVALDVDAYCDFISSISVTPWRYFVLDVVGDPVATRRNYDHMLGRGFHPVPIFTRGEDPAVLEDYYETSDVVAVGGLVATPQNQGFVKGIMEHVGDRRVHWLGFTRQNFLKVYRPYMVDSSSWEAGARFGIFDLYLGRGQFHRCQKNEFRNRPAPHILEAIRSYGLDPADFSKLKGWHGGPSPNRRLNAYSVVRYALDLEHHVGTKFFVAIAAGEGLRFCVEGHQAEMRARHQEAAA